MIGSDKWDNTNQIPTLVRFTLELGGNKLNDHFGDTSSETGRHARRRHSLRHGAGGGAIGRPRRTSPPVYEFHTMKIPVQTQPRGIALIIVMIAIFVLSVMAAIFATSMKVETKLAQNADHDQQLLWLGRSGVELAR